MGNVQAFNELAKPRLKVQAVVQDQVRLGAGNQLPDLPVGDLIVRQIRSFIILLLLAAAVLSVLRGDGAPPPPAAGGGSRFLPARPPGRRGGRWGAGSGPGQSPSHFIGLQFQPPRTPSIDLGA